MAAMMPAHTVTGTALPADQYGPQDTVTRTKPLPTTTTSAPRSTIASLTPGWQTSYSISRNAVYDVPQDWTVPTATTIVGFEGGGGRVVMSGAAELSPVHAVAVPGNNGQSVVKVLYADQGTDGTATDDTIRTMFNSLRPAGLDAAACKQDNDVVGTWCG
ncbi:hypothetical protein [Nocardia sp. NPDC046763]|uniref:hypothetical protein n=1 Tax=Nocardia sp. NPDC046763 TaxID=3155256 RepID=UPI0033FB2EAF